ncbi:cytochrome P450 [Amycolatopsis sp. cg5]|uniref:cytochrome P450 n=1 Tax=Amycolatopsis sp. cg5 TaxID=3238802 RepID=UPI0035231784
MSITPPEPVAYPFNFGPGLDINEAYAAARDTDGMIRVQLPFGEPGWLATRYADVRQVFGDKRFSRALAKQNDPPRMFPTALETGILAEDPPDHTRLRRLVAQAFTMHRVENMRPWVRDLAEGLLDDLIEKGNTGELVEDYALPLPVAVITELLGVPDLDRPKFRKWSDASLSTAQLTVEEAVANRNGLREYLAEFIADHRENPRDDLMSALIQARDVDDRLTELELVDMCVGLLIGGHETTASEIPNFVYVLLEYPQEWKRLLAEPELIPSAVEELTRYVPLGAGATFSRYATEDIEIGGVVVKKGEAVLGAVGPANRDPRRFEDPDTLRLDREHNHHLGFGHGIHHCLGAQLARIELQESLRALLTKMPDLHLIGEIEWKTQRLVRSPRRMPVGW